MNRLHRVAAALVLSTPFVTAVRAQTPPAPTAAGPIPAPTARPALPTQTQTARTAAVPAQNLPRRRSIVQHYPYPYPEYYRNDSTGGFRNPGGTGRYLEYYPPGNQFQNNQETDRVKVATFGGGGVPDRNEQLQAQSVGIARYNAIQGSIDRYARPAFGVGYFGGFN